MNIVITGAAGTIGQCAVQVLDAGHALTLLDLRPHPLRPTVVVDLADAPALQAAIPEGTEAILHLGAHPNEAAPETITRNNLLATANVFEAARQRGVKRVVFASTIQVYGGMHREPELLPVNASRDARPNTHYGLSKLHGEWMGAMYARRHGIAVLAIRFGWYMRRGETTIAPEQAPPYMLSVRDMQQLLVRSIEAPLTGFNVINGVSRGGASVFDLEAGRAVIGFDPQDSAQDAVRQFYDAYGVPVPSGAPAT